MKPLKLQILCKQQTDDLKKLQMLNMKEQNYFKIQYYCQI